MNPNLIDLHVRPVDAQAPIDLNDWAERAKRAGLDGIAIIGSDAPPAMTGEATGVAVFTGVEVDTDVGRLLCYPRDVDEWFAGSGWHDVAKTNGGDPEVYVGEQLIAAFAERGGVVVVAQPYDRDLDHPCGEDAFSQQSGLSAVVVTSAPRHTTSNERAASAAAAAQLPGVGGSASDPTGGRFGAVATLFLRPPRDQQGLVQGIKTGRVWPVEISPAPVAAKAEPKKVREKVEKPEPQRGRRTKKRSRSDDDRGNRLDLALSSLKPTENAFDRAQPDADPIARLYGVDGRKANRLDRYAHLSDVELDRIDGNRARGNDTNVMPPPDFRVMRAERQHVNLLMRTIEQNDHADSVALRFAFRALEEASPEQIAEVEERHEHAVRQSSQRRRRRRRRK